MRIQKKELPVPIIQGGMGVGVSLSKLAGNVAKCGGMGVISSVNAGYEEPDFMILEGHLAGGHLGFTPEELLGGTAKSNEVILEEVLQAIDPYE